MAAHPLETIRPGDLPSPPQAALEIVRACADEEVTNAQLARLVSADPVLTAEILRAVNSAFFGFSREIRSVGQAIAVLGQRALRNLVLCIEVRDLLGAREVTGFDLTAFREDSLRRAVAARLIGSHIGLDQDECFTAGLLQDFGLLALIYVRPEEGVRWPELRAADPEQRHALEVEVFGLSHAQVDFLLSQSWSLPEDLAAALAGHHTGTGTQDQAPPGLCEILHCADWLAAAFHSEDTGRVVDRCQHVLEQTLGLDAEAVGHCLATIPAQVNESAVNLGLSVPNQPELDQVLRSVNAQLAEESLSYQELTWELERTLAERDRLAAELDRELELAREIQRSLLPSGSAVGCPITGLNIPASRLSGDFYDYFQLADGRVYFNLADVSGKGTNAALVMAKTSSLFRCLGKRISHPAELLSVINEELCETSTRGMFVTMVAGLYDPGTQTARLVNAGHLPAIRIDDSGEVSQLEPHGLPLGIMPQTVYAETTIPLQGASLYLFTDGLTEASVSGRQLGVDGLLKLLCSLSLEPAAPRLQAVVERLTRDADALRDDITLLVVQP